jgi:S-DNA-T family DNA segregation ATPase FtsK/SpoIIIE
MASFQARQRDPLLDQGTQAMLERRGRELLGLVLLGLALAFALMLGSHSPEDPGWMVATDEPAQNLLGRLGAAVSSTLVIIIGRGAWAIPAILGAWGLRYVLHRGGERALGRIVFAVIAVAFASVYAATLVPGAGWPHSFGLGGLFGDTILGAMLGMAPGGAGFGLKVVSVLGLAALIALMLYVTGFDHAELQATLRFLIQGAVATYARAAGLAGQGVQVAGRRMQERMDARAARVTGPAGGGGGDAGGAAWAPEPMGQPRPAAAARAVVRRVEPAPAPDARPAAGPDLAPAPLGAAQAWNAPASLRAEPRAFAPPADLPKEKLGFLARMRRAVEPEPELVEPAPSAPLPEGAPSEDRIRSRISDAIRARARGPAAAAAAAPKLSAVQAAVAARREPSLTRPRGPVVLIADTRPGVPAAVAAPVAPRAPAPAPAHAPAHAEAEEDGNLFIADPWDEPAAPASAPASAPAAAAAARPEVLRAADPAPAVVRRGTIPLGLEADAEEEVFADDDSEGESDWVPPAPRPQGTAAPRAIDRRPIVQHTARKAPAPSARAVAESQPRLRFDEALPAYELPPLSLLASPTAAPRTHLSDEALEENARMLESVLDDYGVKGEIVSVRPGPVVTMYELEPAPGLKASRVIGLADDIARSMSALSARVSTVPGRSVIGIELPNAVREKVVLKEILAARDFGDSQLRLPLALGKDIGGDPVVANLAKMPHLLIAGTTGSGKSVAINTMILSLLYKLTPEECRLIMIDPKMLELSVYDGIPHLLSPVVTDPKKAVVALKWVVGEMEERYRKMSKMGVRNIEGYNGRVREALAKGEMFRRTIQTGFDDETGEPVFETEEFAPQPFPYIVVIVDEMADLMMVAGKEIEACIQRLAQMARASGIHLIMATQRPSVDVITGTIKANFPTRISFQVTSKIDSRTILGEQGAEQLLGMGDMLYMGNGAKITRIHGPFVSDEEVEEIVNHLKSFGPPSYMSGVVDGPDEEAAGDIDTVLGLNAGGNTDGDDALYDQAVAIVAKDRKCSTSYIQRKLGIGYNKAARLVEQMEEQGVVTPANHVGKREILVPEG